MNLAEILPECRFALSWRPEYCSMQIVRLEEVRRGAAQC